MMSNINDGTCNDLLKIQAEVRGSYCRRWNESHLPAVHSGIPTYVRV